MVEYSLDSTAFHTYRLDNGLQIVGQYMPDFESVACCFYVLAGSRDEPDPGIAGVSHILEHMIFRTTKAMAKWDFALELDNIGAESNGFTTHEATTYHVHVLGEYLERAFELLSDMIYYPRLSESDCEIEKEIIIAEIARNNGNAYNWCYNTLMKIYFGNHPLGHSVLGTPQSVRNMKVEQVRDFWKKHYVANNMIIAVAGNFDWEHFLHLVKRRCSNWRTGSVVRNTNHYEPSSSRNRIIADKELKQQITTIAMPCVNIRDADYYAATLGGSILGDNDGSRLYWNILQKGLAESASAGVWAMEGIGMMLIEANTTPKEARDVLKLLRAELNSLLEDGVYEDELRRAKEKWIGGVVLSSESVYSRMRTLASDWSIEGRLISVDEEIERVEKVTADDVIRALRRFPMRDKQVIVALGPLNENELLV